MGDAEPPVAAINALKLSEAQLDYFAGLLAKHVNQGNIIWLANSVLGPGAERLAANEVGDPGRFARAIVQAIQDAGRISEAIRVLREQTLRNTWLMVGLNKLLSGEDLPDDATLQAFVNDVEPFLSSKALQEDFPKVLRTVCAVALGHPVNSIVGSGFLIAPDLVMTNFHVLELFLSVDPATKKVTADGPGDQIFFIFDYLSAPAPDLPPVPGQNTMVTAAADWLVYSRISLAGDGTPGASPVTKEHDYAVVRLARPVGALSARTGGGVIRGWLPLPRGKIDTLANRRIIVFQHPQKAPQQWDIGEFVDMDLSATRVRYSVSTAHGSSGGAAVDGEGHLFALHNAEVKQAIEAPAARKLNQGIRIDTIVEDLAAEVPAVLQPTPARDENRLFWSLTDDLRNSSPIIGRARFRDNIVDMLSPNAERMMAVTGPPGSGLQYSIKLLRHTLGIRVPAIVFSPGDLQKREPPQFLANLVKDLGITAPAGKELPDALPTENVSRWISRDIPKWLLERLTEDQEKYPGKYPAWIVIDTVTPNNEGLLWADKLPDCIAALVGKHDPGQPAIDIPQLRWLFLASSASAVPVSGVPKLDEDLGNYATYEEDFIACVALARRATDRQIAEVDVPSLRAFASWIAENHNQLPLRKALANGVRKIISKALTPAGGG